MTPLEVERRNRIRLSVAAYAYEFFDQPVMSDGDFDDLARRIDPEVPTGNRVMDRFFRTEFDPSTGVWIHEHPNQEGLRRILRQVYDLPPKKRRRTMDLI